MKKPKYYLFLLSTIALVNILFSASVFGQYNKASELPKISNEELTKLNRRIGTSESYIKFIGDELRAKFGNENDYYNHYYTIEQEEVKYKGEWYPFGTYKSTYKTTGKTRETGQHRFGKHSEWRSYYPDGTLESIINYQEGKLTGEYKTFYENGKTVVAGSMYQDSKDGKWIYYSRQGETECIENYFSGVLRNDWQLYIAERRRGPNWGKTSLLESRKYDKEGILLEQKNHYMNGQVRNEIKYKYNRDKNEYKPDGPATQYYESGQIKTQKTFKEGNWIGKYVEYYPNGNLYCEIKVPVEEEASKTQATYYYENGNLMMMVEFKNSKDYNVLSAFDSKGNELKKPTFLKDGNGFINIYKENGDVVKRKYQGENLSFNMIHVSGGKFQMGGKLYGLLGPETHPVFNVTLNSFYIKEYEVTVDEFYVFCKDTGREFPKPPSTGWQSGYPMVEVTYNDALAYCEWLGKKFGGKWRLPTEAEWEFAARGGNYSKNYLYSGGDDIREVGWTSLSEVHISASSFNPSIGDVLFKERPKEEQPHPVGQLSPNELGIYDMTGNVDEICLDMYTDYSSGDKVNPIVKRSDKSLGPVTRGGSFIDSDAARRSFNVALKNYELKNRSFMSSDKDQFTGFRVVLEAD
jgi:formylglycine-generating enzyme